MVKELFLAVIVSLDTYLAAAAYSNSGIRIPAVSAAVISLICAAVLGISLEFSGFIGTFIPADICKRLGAAVITAIGVVTIMKSVIRPLFRRLSENGEFSLKMGGFSVAVRLYLDDTAADFDNSKTLSAGEAAALALASSLDSAATGLSSGLSDIRPLTTAVFAFAAGSAAIFLGSFTGKKIAVPGKDLSWIAGVLLILFALFTK